MIVDLVRYEGLAIEGFVQSYFDRLKAHNLPGVVAVPFYCSRSKQEEYLPINLIKTSCGTNGMAAGNSYNEAVYQALCELMERWAAARIFFDRLTPPTIPDDYLKQYPAEFNIIENIQKSGKYSVTIKDFSAGLRLPSVGVIVRNTQKNSYRLNVGCDTSFQVALSRCLTEVYQGMGDEEAFDDISLEIPQEDASCLDQEDEASMQARFSAYSKFTANGTGVFPPSLFRETASYEFDPSIFNGHGSYQEEVETIIAFFHALGYTVYIRDVSYLGFPSVYVYVPEVSSLGKKNVPAHVAKPTYDLIEADKIEPLVYRFKQGHPEDLSQLEASLQTLPIFSVVANLFGIELEEDCPGSFVNVALLLALVWFKLGKLDESAKAFFVYQSNCPDKIGYYQAIEKYVRILASGSSAADSREKLEMELGNTEDVRQACDDIDNIDAFIKRLPLPECPNCSTCLLNADCKTRKLMEVSRRLYPAMTEHNKSRA
jgi:YcaO-like protein with predicted kinase domain